MWIRVEGGGGSENVDKVFCVYVLGLFEGSFGLLQCIFFSIWPISTQNSREKIKKTYNK